MTLGRARSVLVAAALALPFGTVAADETAFDRAQLQRGAEAWENNCARCHKMREPGEFPDRLWRPIVAHMRVRAGLTGEEARAILKFLQAAN